MAQIMDGKALAKKIKEQVAAQAAALPRRPGLAVLLVGENPASQVYVRGKEKDCEECGILNLGAKLPADTTEAIKRFALLGSFSVELMRF